MAKNKLSTVDSNIEAKGAGVKTVWQFVKFLLVSGIVTIIQLGLAYLLPLIFDMDTFKIALPAFLQHIFNPNIIFDVSKGGEIMEKVSTYVLNFNVATNANGLKVLTGAVTWGYALPFLLSNGVANIYGYIQNKKTTFKSDAPQYCFVIYIFLLVSLILFSTWLQGIIYGFLCGLDVPALTGLARLIASLAIGFVQMLVLFPMEKFVLLKEKKPEAVETAKQ